MLQQLKNNIDYKNGKEGNILKKQETLSLIKYKKQI